MKKLLLALAIATGAGAAAAAPLNLTFDTSKAYFGALGEYEKPDNARPDKRGYGARLLVGLPVNDYVNLEATTFADYLKRKHDNTADLHAGFGLDALLLQKNGKTATFLLAGIGGMREDITKVVSYAPYVDFGGGIVGALPFAPKWSVRGEVRGMYEFNDHAAPHTGSDSVFDIRFGLGLQHSFDFGPAPVAVLAPTDSDGDGVLDANDLCPNTPPGTVVDATGCPAAPADSDGDGVVDTLDQCPNTPPGTVVNATGCPLPTASVNPDEDGDGVPNELDKCPHTPPKFKVDSTGCLVEQTVALQNVNFEFGSDKLTEGAKTILDGIAASLLAQTTVKVQVTGHTDSLGPQSYNLALSQRRAKSVLSYLVEKGVEATRLSADGEGEFSPIASNDTEAGRAQNRRVEFKILAQ